MKKTDASVTKTNAVRLCEAAGVPMEVFSYSVEDGRIDALSIAEKLGRIPDEIFKTLVTQGGPKEFFVFVVPADSELDLKKAAKAANVKRIEMLPSRQLLELTGYVHGGCSPVGMKKLFPTFIDESAILFERIWVSAGQIGLNMAVPPESLAGLVDAEFADLTKPKQ